MLIMSIIVLSVLALWDYKNSRSQKNVISTLNEVDSKVSTIAKNFNQELEFHRIERDNLMLQQKQVLENLQNLNKKTDKKKSDIQEVNDELSAMTNKNNGIKKT